MGTLAKQSDSLSRVPSLLDDFFNRDLFNWSLMGNNLSTHGTFPDVNIRNMDDYYELEVAAPGMSKEDIHVELDNDMLVISAEKKEEVNNDKYTKREFNYHTFTRSFTLPERLVEGDKIDARYENGILYVTIPKTEEAKVKPVRKIEIK